MTLQAHPGVEQEDTTISTQMSWDQLTEKQLSNSTDARCAVGWASLTMCLRARSGELRVKVEALLTSACKELMDVWSATNKSFSERIQETERAKKLSMENLEMTSHDLTNMEHHIKLLKKALEEKTCPRMVAESRLEVRMPLTLTWGQVRSHRPGQENCGDLAHVKLREEVG